MSDDFILPTDEQVERAARAICVTEGVDPDAMIAAHVSPKFWQDRAFAAKAHLVILLNKDKILGESGGKNFLDCLVKSIPPDGGQCNEVPVTVGGTGAVTAAKAIENIRATELDCADWRDDILMEIVNAVIAGLQGQDYVSKRED